MTLSAVAVLTTLVLGLAPSVGAASPAGAASPGAMYRRSLEEIELRLRFGIELGPAELEGDIAFSERLCLTAQAAEAAGEAPSARIDRQGLEYVVRRHDLRLTRSIEGTLRGVDRRIDDLGDRFAVTWRGSPPRPEVLRRGVGEVRAGILHLLLGLDRYRQGFRRLLQLDCDRAEAAIEEADRPLRRGLVRVDSGMGILWLLAEP